MLPSSVIWELPPSKCGTGKRLGIGMVDFQVTNQPQEPNCLHIQQIMFLPFHSVTEDGVMHRNIRH